MVMAVKPVILLVNAPVPVPSVVWLPFADGLGDVPQQTPRTVMAAPPSSVILPPLAAVVFVIDVAVVVVSVGMLATPLFSELISFWQLNVTRLSRMMMLKVFMLLFFA